MARLAAVLVAAALAVAACSGGSVKPTASTPTPTASSTGSPSAATLRCRSEASFLIDVAQQIRLAILSVGGTTGESTQVEPAITKSQAQLIRLRAEPMHGARIADKSRLDVGISDVIAGYQAVIAADSHRKKLVLARDQVIKGSDGVAAVQANATNERQACGA